MTQQQALPGCGIPIRYKLNGRLNNNRIKRWNVTKVRELLFADDEGQPHSTAKQCAEASQMTASNMRKWCLQTNAQRPKYSIAYQENAMTYIHSLYVRLMVKI